MTDSEGSVYKKPWVHDSILETQRKEYEAKMAALEAENKRLREEVKFCKSCFKHNPCGNAIKEQDRDGLLRRYRETLVGWLNELRQENHRYREALEQILKPRMGVGLWAVEVAKKALEVQDDISIYRFIGTPAITDDRYGQNAYGSVLAEYDDGRKLPVICGHGGSGWLCFDCAKKALGGKDADK